MYYKNFKLDYISPFLLHSNPNKTTSKKFYKSYTSLKTSTGFNKKRIGFPSLAEPRIIASH